MNVLITGGKGDLAKYLCVQLEELGFQVSAPSRIELDVTDIESVNNYFNNKKFDIVINNAGTLYSSLVADSEPTLWIRDINVNLVGTYLVCRSAILSNKNVKLFNIASTAAFESYKDWTSYCASKAGVLTLSKGLYKDGYYINVLCPGAIDTKIRNGLSINNPNVMSVEEGGKEIISAVLNGHSGQIYYYRKGETKLLAIESIPVIIEDA